MLQRIDELIKLNVLINTNKSYPSPLIKKIAKGLKLSFKLVLYKQKTNGTLFFTTWKNCKNKSKG
jgi:hypothetical protein